jgi:hypothetical protein
MEFGLSFFDVTRKRNLLFITVGELHIGLACDIRLITSWKQIAPKISEKWTGLTVLVSTNPNKDN